MNKATSGNRGIWLAVVAVSGLCLVQPALAQQSEQTWGSLSVQSQATSSERVAYFQSNLRPHRSSTYAKPAYHKKIVQLNWYDNGAPKSRVVNLSRTFDIYGIFKGTSVALTEQAKAILDDLGRAITSEGIDTRMYAIAGHSIDENSKRADQELSTRRAKAVKAYLLAKFGIDASRLVPVGFGSHNLKDKDNPKKAENNRIEICLIEDVYEKEPTTTVQLPDSTSSGPLEIKIASREEAPDAAQPAAVETQEATSGSATRASSSGTVTPTISEAHTKSRPRKHTKKRKQKSRSRTRHGKMIEDKRIQPDHFGGWETESQGTYREPRHGRFDRSAKGANQNDFGRWQAEDDRQYRDPQSGNRQQIWRREDLLDPYDSYK